MKRIMYGAMNTNYKSLILVMSLLFALSASVSAAPGDLDPTFGNGGIVVTSLAPNQYWYDAARTVRVQPDGKIVVGGWITDADNNGDRGFFLARYHPTGALDASFGTNGKIIGPINSGEMVGNDIALQTDGKIIAVGYDYSSYAFAVHRYNANGTLDASFGAGGVVVTPFGGYAASVAIQADGKIVVAGSSSSSGQSYLEFTVVRLLPDGSLDTSFGGTGKVITAFGNPSHAGRVIAQPDGKIVAVGSAYVGNNQGLALVRYNSDGSLDSGFGSGGKIIHGVFNPSLFWFGDAVLQPDVKIIASGHFYTLSGGNGWDVIFRINPNGSRDPSFAFLSAENLYIGRGIALQTDGKSVFFGYENSGGNYRFAILRLNPNGVPDTGFGTNGRVFTQIGSSSSAVDGAVQPDGKILALGNSGITIARYRGDSAPTSPCGNPIDCAEFFVRQQYRDFLGREAEPDGLQFYLNMLAGCGSTDTECIRYTRGALSANFFRSPEFGRKGAYLANLFNIVIGQRPKTVAELSDSTKVDRPHYAEFMTDLASLSTPNDDPVLTDQRKDQLAVAWLARGEVQAILPGSLSNQQFVQKLESIAGVALANESTLIANLNSGSQTRAQVLRAIAESPEVFTKFYIPNFVTMEYFGYLRRDPEDCHNPANWGGGDPNQCGYIFHNNRFNTPGANPDLIENIIVRGFIESPEYRGRF